jgi:hypothetical protein
MEIELDADGPTSVVVSQLADPAWEAEWHPASGVARAPTIRRAFGGWQAVEIPSGVGGRLVLDYPARVERRSLAFSAACWLIWALGLIRISSRGRTPVSDASRSAPGFAP